MRLERPSSPRTRGLTPSSPSLHIRASLPSRFTRLKTVLLQACRFPARAYVTPASPVVHEISTAGVLQLLWIQILIRRLPQHHTWIRHGPDVPVLGSTRKETRRTVYAMRRDVSVMCKDVCVWHTGVCT